MKQELIKKVLIAIDESASSLSAALFGVEYAMNFNLEVGIIEVTNYSSGDLDTGVLPENIEKAGQFQAKVNIEQVKALFPSVEIKEFEPIGEPIGEINKAIQLYNADMLIIGHQTHSVWHRLFNKNIELQLANHINIPLLIIPEKK